MPAQIVGIDCATKPKKVGLARATFGYERWSVDEVVRCKTEQALHSTLQSWLSEKDPTLLAMDAPLGWPKALGAALCNHRAGDAFTIDPGLLFRRQTDETVKKNLGITPLDVGADRIARTAEWALRFLRELRDRTDQELPLAWKPGRLAQSSVIEVYPAATLVANGQERKGYKKAIAKRGKIVSFLAERLSLSERLQEQIRNSHDEMDAVVCVLAGLEVLNRLVEEPDSQAEAKVEGFIWFRRPLGSGSETARRRGKGHT